MFGFHLLNFIDIKCVPCVNYSNCKLKEHYKKISEDLKVDTKEVEKLNHCLFFRKII